MYENIVEEMKRMAKDIEQGKADVMKMYAENSLTAENAKINNELKKKNIKTINFEDLQKMTGAKYAKRKK